MRPVALLQHDHTQRPGLLLDFLNEMGIPTVTYMPHEEGAAPVNARDYSGIALLGSQNSVNDPLPWINDEVALFQCALSTDIPVLGHCFGAQIMAKAMGARVRRNAWPHIGWGTLRATPDARQLFNATHVPTFNWHYETFGIPLGAQRLLFGQYCINKGFQIGKHLAFQCHFEVTESIIQEWCAQGEPELLTAQGPTVQPVTEILKAMHEELPKVQRIARHIYGKWASNLLRTSPSINRICQ